MAIESEERRLSRSCLGRTAFIGQLYDARREILTPRSLFKNLLGPNFIKQQDITKTEMEYKFTENVSDRFDLLKVEAELQVAILLGLFKAEGSGHFLTEEKLSENTVSCSLLCKFETVCEILFSNFEEIIPHMDLEALQDTSYTHVIVEINWGANCLLTLEATQSCESEKKEIEGFMKAKLSAIGAIVKPEGKGQVEKKVNKSDMKNDITVKVSADIISEKGLPTSVESFREFVLEIPSLIKKVNQGKGKPINFGAVSLNFFRKVAKIESTANDLVTSIDESFLFSILYLFEEIGSVKRKFHDLNKEMTDFLKYMNLSDVREARKQKESLEMKESQLKTVIAQEWTKVRSGEQSLRNLIKMVKQFENHDLCLSSFEDFIDSCSRIKKRLEAIKNFLSQGCIYLGRDETFSDLMVKNSTMEFIILVLSFESETADPELHLNTCCFFLTLVNERNPNTVYVVVDLDFQKDEVASLFSFNQTKCLRWKEGRILNSDIYQEYLVEESSNFGRLCTNGKLEHFKRKPGNRVPLEMTCPGFLERSCAPDKSKWICLNCKSTIEYGFDDYFYCLCGGGKTNQFEFRCNQRQHNSFICPDISFLKNELSSLRPFKELNVLILGQSGVGKSTWINSILNYMSYDTMEKAKEGGAICEIPVTFTITNAKTLKNHEVSVGTASEGEDTTAGQSATQFCHTYTFFWEDRYVRLIDSPGLGDTRGIDQDKKNMENVVGHIRHFKELHGICILLKASDNRLNAIFSYCVKELLVHLHKSVAHNIVFCFTNSRTSFYGPGRTSVLLQNLIQTLDVKEELALGPHNMFYLDNEAFVFLCTLTNPEVQYEKHLVESFAKSWEISSNESLRLFKTIRNFQPHLLQETLSLVAARNRIVTLTVPLAQVSKTIQLNLAAIDRKKKEIESFDLSIQDLMKKLKVNEIHLEPEYLPRPRTVCTSSDCIEYHAYQSLDVTAIEYKTVCHDQCYLKNVEAKTVNNERLKDCKAMKNGYCTVCGCGWQVHMHLTFAQKRVEREAVNKKVETDVLKEKSDMEKVQQFVDNLEKKTEKYKKEQEIILQTSVKFGMFLKQNAITVYNDSVRDYLEYLIQEEENKPHKTKEEKDLIKSMKQTLDNYNAEVKVLQEVIQKSGDAGVQISSDEIFVLEKQLYALELTGEDIEKNVNASRIYGEKAFQYAETPLKIKKQGTSQGKNKSMKKQNEGRKFNFSSLKLW